MSAGSGFLSPVRRPHIRIVEPQTWLAFASVCQIRSSLSIDGHHSWRSWCRSWHHRVINRRCRQGNVCHMILPVHNESSAQHLAEVALERQLPISISGPWVERDPIGSVYQSVSLDDRYTMQHYQTVTESTAVDMYWDDCGTHVKRKTQTPTTDMFVESQNFQEGQGNDEASKSDVRLNQYFCDPIIVTSCVAGIPNLSHNILKKHTPARTCRFSPNT